MLTAKYEVVEGMYYKYLGVSKLDDEQFSRVEKIFIEYHRKGVILNDSIEDLVWEVTNENVTQKLKFYLSETTYYHKAYYWIGTSYITFLKCMKAYILLCLGDLGLSSLREILHSIINVAGMTQKEILRQVKGINHYISFLQIIPDSNEICDNVIESLEEILCKKRICKKSKQRALADFDTYLKFNEHMTEFWNYADDEEKLYFFPLYFWWKLTSILPLRVTEFLLIPRDCLERNIGGENILTIRRTKLKRKSEKVTYTIEGDYEKKKYSIPDNLANDIVWYMKATENSEKPTIETLFIIEPRYSSKVIYEKNKNRHYSYADLKLCLSEFYTNVIWKNGFQLDKINLGDTRHIAMASLIISGGSPVICKELAGHANIEISSHYYTNISNLVECITMDQYHKFKGNKAEFTGIPRYPTTVPNEKHRIGNGWCDVIAVKNGDVSECVKVVDGNGHIGVCESCIHYWPDQNGVRLKFLDEKAGKEKVDMDTKFLLQVIETVRKGIGMDEEIERALLKLQRSSNHYSRCLWEKYTNMEV